MARIYGLNGALRGRQGNNVFSVQNGTQVVKAYQPVVSNPRTPLQRAQRAKFALAGKISGITPNDAIIGLSGGSPRSRRADFVRRLTLAAQVSANENGIVANVPYGSIVYAVGSLAIYTAPVTITAAWYGAADSSRVTVSIPRMSDSGVGMPKPSGYGELAVVALYDSATSQLDEVQVVERNYTDASSVYFRQGARRDCHVAVYFVPFTTESAVAGQRAGLLADAESAVNLSTTIASRLSSANFGASVLQAVVGVIGSQMSNSPAPNDENRFETDKDSGDVKRKK